MPSPRRLRGGWYVQRDGGRYVLARHWPPRFDVCAVSVFPPVRAGRLAQQIRQDLWRILKGLRGFSPVVQIDASDEGCKVHAGGRLVGNAPKEIESHIRNLLDSPTHRARWLSWAGKGGQ